MKSRNTAAKKIMKNVSPVSNAKKQTSTRTIPAPIIVKKPRKVREPRIKLPLGVVDQVRVAFKSQNRLATTVGALLGGVVPLASYWLAHFEVNRDAELYSQLPSWLVLGGLVFSATTVYGWAKLAFGSGVKATGFCVLAEGVLLASRTPWLSVLVLVYLIAINATATACRLAGATVDAPKKQAWETLWG